MAKGSMALKGLQELWYRKAYNALLLQSLTPTAVEAGPHNPGEAIRWIPSVRIENQEKRALFTRPPVRVTYRLTVPPRAMFRTFVTLLPEVWGKNTGGVEFDVSISPQGGGRSLKRKRWIHPTRFPYHRQWVEFRLDLHSFAHREVDLTLSTAVPAGATADFAWAVWGDPLILSRKPFREVWALGRMYLKLYGLKGFLKSAIKAVKRAHTFATYVSPQDYQQWIRMYDTLDEGDRRAIRAHIERLAYKPLISVIMPTYNTPEPWLRRAIESVRNQLYPYWELCIADDASEAPHVRQILQEYQEKEPRIRVVFCEHRIHVSECSNKALELARGEFIALLDHDDELAEHALYMVVVELNAHPEADILYSDEDKIDSQGNRFDPYFKPDWNPDLFYGQNLITHLGVYRTRLVREVGGFRPGYEGAQDWDLALRIIERIPSSHIRHIPFVLYHWRAIPGSTATSMEGKPYAYEAQRKALTSHFERCGIPVRLHPVHGVFWRVEYPLPPNPPLVSLIIPTRNNYELLARCIESILQKTTYWPLEILIVNHQSDDPQTLAYLGRLSKEAKARIINYEGPFNFSRINNWAVLHAHGKILGFLNDDVEVISPVWLEEMVRHALRPEVGAVGAMLYYPDDTIQHAGVILGLFGVAGHAYRYLARGTPGQMGRAWLAQDLSAVTGACLLVRREVFEEVGGFDEGLAVAFNDVDLCLRIRERGYRILWTPFAELYHREGASRGRDTIESARFLGEIQFMRERWGERLFHDPAYNPNLTLDREDFSLAFPPRVSKPWK